MPAAFFDLADEMGLLLWQEFPYACAGYPVEAATLADAAAETTDITREIGSHASLFLWGGNNEVAQLHGGKSGYLPGQPGWVNYGALFLSTIGPAVEGADSSRPYRASSPGSGFETAAVPIPDQPQQAFLGDMHVRGCD